MSITIEPMRQEDIPVVVDLMARAYYTNPVNLAAMGTDLNIYRKFMTLALERLAGQTFVAKESEHKVEWGNFASRLNGGNDASDFSN